MTILFVITIWLTLHVLDLYFFATLAPKPTKYYLYGVAVVFNSLFVYIFALLISRNETLQNYILLLISIFIGVCFDTGILSIRRRMVSRIQFLQTTCPICRSNVYLRRLASNVSQCPVCDQYFTTNIAKHSLYIIEQGFILYLIKKVSYLIYATILKKVIASLLHVFFPSKKGTSVMLNSILGCAIGGIFLSTNLSFIKSILSGALFGILFGLLAVKLFHAHPKPLLSAIGGAIVSTLWLSFVNILWAELIGIQFQDDSVHSLVWGLVPVINGGLGATIPYKAIIFMVLGTLKGLLGWAIGAFIGLVINYLISKMMLFFGVTLEIRELATIVFGILGAIIGLVSALDDI